MRSLSAGALVLCLVVPALAMGTACGRAGEIAGDAALSDASVNGGSTGTNGDSSSSSAADDDSGGGGGTANGDDGSASGDPNANGTLAASAAAFLATIGVCTHIGQGVDDPASVATALKYLGAREIRDDGNPAHAQDWINVHNATGVKLSLLTNQDVPQTVELAKQLNAASALLAVEGPNEPNNFPVTYGGATSSFSGSFVPVANLQNDLYAAVHAEPALAGIPVFHSSEAGGSEPDDVGLQFLTVPGDGGTMVPTGTRYADYANTHNYICGHENKLVDNTAWQAEDPTLDGDWDGMHVEYGTTWNKQFNGNSLRALPTIPRVTTETGWQTDGTGSITQEQQARLFLDLYLSAYKEGWSYTFVYMLRDEPGQGDWGFFDMKYAAKTSGTYLHNFTTILADTENPRNASPAHLAYSIASEPATVHDLLLQKSTGSFELMVWDEHFSGGTDAVTVSLADATDVTIYDPTTGTTATTTMKAVTEVPLLLSDHPMILELSH